MWHFIVSKMKTGKRLQRTYINYLGENKYILCKLKKRYDDKVVG